MGRIDGLFHLHQLVRAYGFEGLHNPAGPANFNKSCRRLSAEPKVHPWITRRLITASRGHSGVLVS